MLSCCVRIASWPRLAQTTRVGQGRQLKCRQWSRLPPRPGLADDLGNRDHPYGEDASVAAPGARRARGGDRLGARQTSCREAGAISSSRCKAAVRSPCEARLGRPRVLRAIGGGRTCRLGAIGLNLLLDTHALLWWIAGGSSLSPTAHSAVADENNAVCVSAATTWEITTRFRIGKLLGVTAIVADLAAPSLWPVSMAAHSDRRKPNSATDRTPTRWLRRVESGRALAGGGMRR